MRVTDARFIVISFGLRRLGGISVHHGRLATSSLGSPVIKSHSLRCHLRLDINDLTFLIGLSKYGAIGGIGAHFFNRVLSKVYIPSFKLSMCMYIFLKITTFSHGKTFEQTGFYYLNSPHSLSTGPKVFSVLDPVLRLLVTLFCKNFVNL